MKSKMIAFTAFFTVAAGFGAGGASASYFQVNPRICNEKNIYRNGNRVVASLTEAGLAKVRASADVGPKVRETIIPACPPTTQCGPDIAPPANVDVEQKVRETIIPICVPGTQCVPDIAPPANVDVEQKVRETIIPICVPGTQCGPDITRPTSVDLEPKVREAIIPACPSGTQCGPDIAPASVSSRFDEGE